jgi:hypothetical protein
MTGQERDHGEVLSRVLHSAMDQVEPVGDGLTKIQARLAEPWLKRQWWLLRTEFTILGWVLAVRCQSWFSALRSGSAAGADADDVTVAADAADDGGQLRALRVLGSLATRVSPKRSRKAGAPWRGSVGPVVTWLRPALAVAGAVVLVVAGVFALGQFQTFAGLTGDHPHGTGSSSQSGGPGGTNGNGTPAGSAGPSATQGNATSASPGSSPSGSVSPSPTASSLPSSPPASPPASPPPPSPSPSPSPTTSPSSSPSPTTSTPTPTTSQAPMATDSPTASPPAGG